MTKYRFAHRTIVLTIVMACSRITGAAAATPPAYYVTDLGTLGGSFSESWAINANGQVTGRSTTTGNTDEHAFLWTPTTPGGASGTMQDLGTLGGAHSIGYGVNASGHVTGESYAPDLTGHAFLHDGVIHDLGTLGGGQSVGWGINDSGQVAGWSSTNGDAAYRAFLYDGTLHDLGTLGGTSSYGYDINASGQVTGFSQTTEDANTHAFLWTPTTPGGASGTMIGLGTLGGTYSGGESINAFGLVTGSSLTSENAAYHAFLYDGTLHDLGTLGGINSFGFGINARGQVVGSSTLAGGAPEHAFLFTSGDGMVDLDTLIDPLSGWELFVAGAINDAGQIAGHGLIGGENHAFLLTPVPEPGTALLLLIGGLIALRRQSVRASREAISIGV